MNRSRNRVRLLVVAVLLSLSGVALGLDVLTTAWTKSNLDSLNLLTPNELTTELANNPKYLEEDSIRNAPYLADELGVSVDRFEPRRQRGVTDCVPTERKFWGPQSGGI